MTEFGAGQPSVGQHDGVLLDLDGTAYRGSEVIPGASEAIDALRAQGIVIRFVTNNAAKTGVEVVEGLRRAGFIAERSEVHTSSDAAAEVLRNGLATGSRVLVLGTEGLADHIRDAGLEPVRTAQGQVAAVVQGHNPDTGWRELAEACMAIRAGAWWVVCNRDATLPGERGELPGNGAMVAALRVATGAEPVVAGKPREPLLVLAGKAGGCVDPLVIGDRLETDIAGAHAAGMDALLVLSGVSGPARLLGAEPDERPRYVAADVASLRSPLAELEVGSATGPVAWRVEAMDEYVSVFSDRVQRDEGSDAASASPGAAAMALLRRLCPVAWSIGSSAVWPGDEYARSVLGELGLVGAGAPGE